MRSRIKKSLFCKIEGYQHFLPGRNISKKQADAISSEANSKAFVTLLPKILLAV